MKQPESQKHPCSYCGMLVGSGAFMHLQKHKRNRDVPTYLQNGKEQSILKALQNAFDGTKYKLSKIQDEIASLSKLRSEEARLIHLLSSLEAALGKYMEGEPKGNEISQPT